MEMKKLENKINPFSNGFILFSNGLVMIAQ
jgi:hypothetical protein